MSDRRTPSFGQYLGYLVGRTLPDSMQDWVRNDVMGPGSSVRYVLRFTLPLIPIFVAFYLLIPGERWIPLAMMALLLLPVLYFAIALMNIYRRHRLLSHGLDPELLGERARSRAARTRDDYESRHGRGTGE
ncbi:DUF5313 family protein [Rhodococcus sp. NPDC058505]|uniref:DUF5313 family protein n=1 Tax=unclassified Rhodococcus (in: high G+C Gram-positive bacteria) TaxID=192944 RepID=UPI003655158C